MRDLKLFYEDGFDIDVSASGDPVYVDEENQTLDQRAAVAVTIMKGSIPGAPSIGTDWGVLADTPTIDATNQAITTLYDSAKNMISECAGNNENIAQQYYPLLSKDEDTGRFTIQTLKGGES